MDERILIIEDDEEIQRLLKRALTYQGYIVDTALSGKAGLKLASEQRPDLVILDLMLPGMDGMEVCRKLQKIGKQPILMLTAKDTTQDRVHGLDAGADDYVVKPFEMDELIARIRALLRRTLADRVKVLAFEDLQLDSGTRRAYRGDREIVLTTKEYDLLDCFAPSPQVMTREVIFDQFKVMIRWREQCPGYYIRYIRQSWKKMVNRVQSNCPWQDVLRGPEE